MRELRPARANEGIALGLLREENPTRRQILEFLRTRGPSTTEALGRILNITPMGVRQHLLTLERKGLVSYKAQKVGVGRPRFLYYLTEEAEELFPKNYGEFSIGLLRSIEKLEGRKKIKKYLEQLKQDMLRQFRENYPDSGSIEDRINNFVKFLSSMDYFIEQTSQNGQYFVKNYNCPVHRIAKHYPEVCAMEFDFFKEALGGQVQRQSCIQQGDLACTFVISPAG